MTEYETTIWVKAPEVKKVEVKNWRGRVVGYKFVEEPIKHIPDGSKEKPFITIEDAINVIYR